MANGVIQIGYYKASWHPSFFIACAAMFVFLVALYVVNHNSRNLFNLHSALSMYEFNIWPGRADQVLRKKTPIVFHLQYVATQK